MEKQNLFPMRVFPQEIITLIQDLNQEQGYPVNYTAAAFMSAVSTVIGNSVVLKVREG